MPVRPKLSAIDVAHAYARCAGLSTKWPIDILIETVSPRAARRAIIQAVCRGEIEHSGDPERGWLTAKGIALLDSETQAEYRAAILRKARIIP